MLISFLLQSLVARGANPGLWALVSSSAKLDPLWPSYPMELDGREPLDFQGWTQEGCGVTRISWSADLSTRLHAVRKPRPWERPTWKLTEASIHSSADPPESIQWWPLTLRKATLELLLPCGSPAALIPREAEAPSSWVTELWEIITCFMQLCCGMVCCPETDNQNKKC